MNEYQNNRNEYVKRCLVFTALLAICIFIFWFVMTYNNDVAGVETARLIGVVTPIIFALWQYIDTKHLLNTPDTEAELITRGDIAKRWARKVGISFGGILAILYAISNPYEFGEYVFTLIVGCGIFGGIAYLIARPIASLISPEKFRPWRTQEAYQAYLLREEQRRREAAAKAAYLAQRMQNTSNFTPSTTPEPTQSTAPVSDIRGRIYRGQYSGTEIGYYTGDTVYKKGDFLTDTKVGKYSYGRIDDDSGVWSAHTVGRYEWSNTYNGYLIYGGDSRKEFVGRVCRNGDIQAAKQPNGMTEIVLQGVEYTTIGRFTGDPEGAAAAAYLLLFH